MTIFIKSFFNQIPPLLVYKEKWSYDLATLVFELRVEAETDFRVVGIDHGRCKDEMQIHLHQEMKLI